MYNTSSLRSKCHKKRRLFSLRSRQNSLSTTDINNDFPYSLSNWGSQASLHSMLNKSCGTLTPRRCSLFQTSSSGIWNGLEDETDRECQEKDGKKIMKVYNVDGTYKSIRLNDDMRVGQICEIMLDKNHRQDSIVHWQIFVEPGDFSGFERQVEDHEFAMDIDRRWPTTIAPSKIWFRHNRKKYNFTKDLDRLLSHGDATLEGDKLYQNISCPGTSEGMVMMKQPQGKWSKVFCFLVMSAAFCSKRNFNYSKKKSKYLFDLTSMDIYVPQEKTNVTKILHTPTPHTLLLVPSSIGLLDPNAIFAIGCKTRESMLSWAEGMRFHKHGQRNLSENLENALNRRFSHQADVTNQNGSTMNESTSEIVNGQIMSAFNKSLVNAEPPKSIVNGNQSGAMSPQVFDFTTETPRLYKQIRSSQQTVFGNDYHSTYSPEEYQGYFHFNGNVQNNPEKKPFTPNTNRGRSLFQQELVSRLSVYEPENKFEGIVFQSGVPFLQLGLPDGLHKYSIEVNQDRSFDEKRYKLPSRSERFETLSDLCTFYENRRHLLLEDRSLKEMSPSNHGLPSYRDDSATAF